MEPSDAEKKAVLLFKGGEDMKTLFQHVGKVLGTDTYEQAVKKLSDGLSERINKVVQRNMLLSNFPQVSKSFKKWFQEVSNAAKLINYDNYDWQQVAVDAIILQTSNAALCEQALQENVTYDQLLKMSIVKEQSAKGAALLEQASGQQSVKVKVEEEVRRLQSENKQLKSKMSQQQHYPCGRKKCPQGSKCPANGQKCSKCKKNSRSNLVQGNCMLFSVHGASISIDIWLWGPAQLVVKSRNVSEKPLRIERTRSISRMTY